MQQVLQSYIWYECEGWFRFFVIFEMIFHPRSRMEKKESTKNVILLP